MFKTGDGLLLKIKCDQIKYWRRTDVTKLNTELLDNSWLNVTKLI